MRPSATPGRPNFEAMPIGACQRGGSPSSGTALYAFRVEPMQGQKSGHCSSQTIADPGVVPSEVTIGEPDPQVSGSEVWWISSNFGSSPSGLYLRISRPPESPTPGMKTYPPSPG